MMQGFKNKTWLALTFAACHIFISWDVNDSDGSGKSYSYKLRWQTTIKLDTTPRQAGPDSSIGIHTFSVESGNDNGFTYDHQHTANVPIKFEEPFYVG